MGMTSPSSYLLKYRTPSLTVHVSASSRAAVTLNPNFVSASFTARSTPTPLSPPVSSKTSPSLFTCTTSLLNICTTVTPSSRLM